MENYTLRTILIYLSVSLIKCTPRRIKSNTTKKFHRTGEAIALDNLIKTYEKEHQQFFKEANKNGGCLEWSALDEKNHSDYCRNYLQQIVPKRNSDNITGTKIKRRLFYGKHNANKTNEVFVILCKFMYKNNEVIYYATRAPEPNCVYALKCTRHKIALYTIINKYCEFENNSLKRKREEIVNVIHLRTGQPIATDEYLLKYELEHQKLVETDKFGGKRIEWPYAIDHHNLNSYCTQFVEECAPTRNREDITGNWSMDKLHYQKFKIKEDISVTIITCVTTNASELRYYMTRAPETNCVYSLLRLGRAHNPLVIIFKYCDIDNPKSAQNISQAYNILDSAKIPKTELKVSTLETLNVFPED